MADFRQCMVVCHCVDNSSTVHGQGGIRPLVEQGLVAGQWNFVRLFINKV